MAGSEKLSKKQIKELKKLEKLQSRNIEQKQNMIKWVAIGLVSFLFLVFFVGLVINGKNRNKPKTSDGKVAISESSGHVRMGKLSDEEFATNSAKADLAKVTLVEYADFQCPACKAYHPVVKNLLELYPEQVKLVLKHFPLTATHKNAVGAAIAAEAAGKQNKFFAYADKLYETQEEWSSLSDPQAKFIEYAKTLGLNTDQFNSDMKDKSLADKIESERNEGIKNGVNGTPTFFLNGERFESPSDLEGFKKAVDEILKKAGTKETKSSEVSPTQAGGSLPLQ